MRGRLQKCIIITEKSKLDCGTWFGCIQVDTFYSCLLMWCTRRSQNKKTKWTFEKRGRKNMIYETNSYAKNHTRGARDTNCVGLRSGNGKIFFLTYFFLLKFSSSSATIFFPFCFCSGIHRKILVKAKRRLTVVGLWRLRRRQKKVAEDDLECI